MYWLAQTIGNSEKASCDKLNFQTSELTASVEVNAGLTEVYPLVERIQAERTWVGVPTTRETVIAAARTAFPGSDLAAIVELLDHYGTEPYERERERVQLAILALSQGSEDKLLQFIQAAKTDYRDVLSWVETGPLSEAQGEEARQAAMRLVERWGDKGSG